MLLFRLNKKPLLLQYLWASNILVIAAVQVPPQWSENILCQHIEFVSSIEFRVMAILSESTEGFI